LKAGIFDGPQIREDDENTIIGLTGKSNKRGLHSSLFGRISWATIVVQREVEDFLSSFNALNRRPHVNKAAFPFSTLGLLP